MMIGCQNKNIIKVLIVLYLNTNVDICDSVHILVAIWQPQQMEIVVFCRSNVKTSNQVP